MRSSLRALLCLVLTLCCWAESYGQAAPGPTSPYIDAQPPLDIKKAKAAEDYLAGKAGATDASSVQALVRWEMSRLTERYEGRDAKIPSFNAAKSRINAWLNAPNQKPDARVKLVTELNSIAYGYAVSNNLRPAHRINAVYIIGELDQEKDPKAGTRVPFTQATGSLFKILQDAKQPGFVKVPALAALERHIRDGWKGWPANTKDSLRKLVAGYANNKPKDDMDRPINTWMVRRALDILRFMGAYDGVNSALAYLADPKELPSLRTSSLEYLQAMDPSKFDAPRKELYMLGLVHFTRSQLVDWYQIETDHSRRKSMGAGGFSGGGMMGGYGGDAMGAGDMGAGFGGAGYGGAGYGGDAAGAGGFGMPGAGGGAGYGGEGFGGRAGNRPRLMDIQHWQTRVARRRLNEVSQLVHRAIDGKRLATDSGNSVSSIHLSLPNVIDESYRLSKLITLVDDFQTAINDPYRVTTVTTLMNISKKPIEEIMEFAKETPGFLEKYPELKDDEEMLEEAVEVKPDKTTENGADGADKPATDASAAPPTSGPQPDGAAAIPPAAGANQ